MERDGSQQLEEVRRDPRANYDLGVALPGNGKGPVRPGGQILNRADTIADCRVRFGRWSAPFLPVDPDRDEAIGVRIGKRAEHNRFHRAEDGRVRANPQCQCQYGQDRKAGCSQQRPTSISEILEEGIHHRQTPLMAVGVFGSGNAPELDFRAPGSGLGVHSGAKIVFGLHRDVSGEFLGHLALAFFSGKRPDDAHPASPKRFHGASSCRSENRAMISLI